jgi:hypothetical protein
MILDSGKSLPDGPQNASHRPPFEILWAASEGVYDFSLPGKISTLLEHLPQQVAECKAMRVSSNE